MYSEVSLYTEVKELLGGLVSGAAAIVQWHAMAQLD